MTHITPRNKSTPKLEAWLPTRFNCMTTPTLLIAKLKNDDKEGGNLAIQEYY